MEESKTKGNRTYKIFLCIMAIIIVALGIVIVYAFTKDNEEHLKLDKVKTVNLTITTDNFCIVDSCSIILKNDSHDFKIYQILVDSEDDEVYRTSHEFNYVNENDHLIECNGHVNLTFNAIIKYLDGSLSRLTTSTECYTKLVDGVIYFFEDEECNRQIAPSCTNTRLDIDASLTATFRVSVETTYNDNL